MPATPLSATTRYAVKGTRVIDFLTTCANINSPTRAEINAGTDLTGQIQSMSGFTISTDQLDVPDLLNRFTSRVPGPITAEDSSITFHLSSTSADVRTVLPRDTTGYILCMWEGEGTPKKMDVFPVKVGSASIQTDIDGTGLIEIAMVITSTPAQNVTIPA